ncbi:hypothetical protein BD410DRAFT_734279 [Rickenella mellea]|uniref:Chromo domain-containing protein n=1 Tax=Rickenella mellea TaxID=50990 RepID=A0A4Y7PH19_9AGAM|nr:hypothetical protein BD410DRAFT_734279 [Rickenella mellea]
MVTRACPEVSKYTIELPQVLADRRIHLSFHASVLFPHELNDDALFPKRNVTAFYDFGHATEEEFLVDEIVGHAWVDSQIFFHVRWTQGDHTWEPIAHCKDLAALDRYLELRGISSWRKLPKHSAKLVNSQPTTAPQP